MRFLITLLALCLCIQSIRTACSDKDGATGSDPNSCSCKANFLESGSDATDQNIVCTCPPTFSKSGSGGSATCTACPLGSTTALDNSPTCTCVTGSGSLFTGTNAPCTCPSPNKVVPGGANVAAQCIACPTNAISQPASVTSGPRQPYTGAATCICKAGYYGDGTTCTGCPAGFTSAAGSTGPTDCNACTQTNAEYVAASGQTAAACRCKAGYYGDGATCTACPTGQTSAAGSTAQSDCATSSSGEVIKAGICVGMSALLVILH